MIRLKLLVAEDDEGMRDFYSRFFQGLHPGEFDASIAADGRKAAEFLSSRRPDLAVLDWRLPGISGLDLLKAIRSHPGTRSIGVIMVTALGSPEEVVEALEAGADDHLAKPFDESVLLARLRSIGRRLAPASGGRGGTLVFGGVRLDPDSERAFVDGVEVRLRPKEFDLLAVLMARPGVLHALSSLWDSVWDYESADWKHVLAVTVSSLRRKLGPRWGACLECHKGRGYVLGR